MKTLTILRHAKSGWDDPVARDYDRGLNARGRRAAELVGAHAARGGLAPDALYASPAVRVAETLDIFLPAARLTALNAHWDRRIYLASSATLLDVLRDCATEAQHVLMAGHNPGLEDLILGLVPDDGSNPRRDVVEDKFPTAALATLTLDIASWRDVADGCAQLTALLLPRELDPALGPEE